MKFLIQDTEEVTLGEINDYLRQELALTNLNKDDIVIEKSLKRKVAIMELSRIFDENGMAKFYEMDADGMMHLKHTGNIIEFSADELDSRFDDAYQSILEGLN